jgi:hypothetical protein
MNDQLPTQITPAERRLTDAEFQHLVSYELTRDNTCEESCGRVAEECNHGRAEKR